jgi:cytochrome c
MLAEIGIALSASACLLYGAAAMHLSPASISEQASPTSPEGGDHPPGASLELIQQGETLYQRRCGACHSLDQNRIGPMHRGVYGRKAGSVESFRYSPALRDLDVIWNSETLDAWLQNPTAFAPGTTMGFRLTNAEERRAIVAYLRSLSDASGAGDPD